MSSPARFILPALRTAGILSETLQIPASATRQCETTRYIARAEWRAPFAGRGARSDGAASKITSSHSQARTRRCQSDPSTAASPATLSPPIAPNPTGAKYTPRSDICRLQPARSGLDWGYVMQVRRAKCISHLPVTERILRLLTSIFAKK